jgi:hypothetical protein
MARRLTLDLAMTIMMLVSIAYQLTGNTVHELVGILISVLLIVHSILNWRWYVNLRKGRHHPRRLVSIMVNLLLLTVTTSLIVSGIINSHIIFSFLKIRLNVSTRQFHALAAYWFLIFMSIHLGMHWKMIMADVRKMAGLTETSRISTFFLRTLSALIVIHGINSSFERNIFSKLTAYYSFDYWDFNKSVTGFFAQYLSIMSIYICLAYYALRLFGNQGQTSRKS